MQTTQYAFSSFPFSELPDDLREGNCTITATAVTLTSYPTIFGCNYLSNIAAYRKQSRIKASACGCRNSSCTVSTSIS